MTVEKQAVSEVRSHGVPTRGAGGSRKLIRGHSHPAGQPLRVPRVRRAVRGGAAAKDDDGAM